jgi:hemoglobin
VRTGGSIYEEAGGAVGLGAAVTVFYARVVADPELAGYFAGVDLDRLHAHQRAFLAMAFGGPDVYTGRPLDRAHARLGITDAHFDRAVEHLAQSLADLGLAPAAVAVVRTRVGALRASIVAPREGPDAAPRAL